jgi:hypothetical protein
MGTGEKRIYLEAIRSRYHQAGRAGKSTILDEFCAVCGYQRKYAIRLLGAAPTPSRQRPGRPSPYRHPQLLEALRRLWLATDQMCGKRLVAAIPLWLPYYETQYGPVEAGIKARLLRASAATLDRLLRPVRLHHPKGLTATRPGTLLKSQIPIRTEHWDITQPGFVEADTVAHCGHSLAGDFVWSLTLSDIDTGWTECRATWNKGAHGVITQITAIERALPFPLRGFDCDNGSEFLNHHLLHYFADHPHRPAFTRSRPYHKNDNAHVEQKNWSHVRQLFGYDRFEQVQLVDLMNEVYAHEWSALQNHFCPTLKLKEKSRMGARYRKTYHTPQTPYQRILASPHITDTTKECLAERHHTLNPFDLKQRIEAKLRVIFSLVTVSSHVRHRL